MHKVEFCLLNLYKKSIVKKPKENSNQERKKPTKPRHTIVQLGCIEHEKIIISEKRELEQKIPISALSQFGIGHVDLNQRISFLGLNFPTNNRGIKIKGNTDIGHFKCIIIIFAIIGITGAYCMGFFIPR
jgi:hypothetical protein